MQDPPASPKSCQQDPLVSSKAKKQEFPTSPNTRKHSALTSLNTCKLESPLTPNRQDKNLQVSKNPHVTRSHNLIKGSPITRSQETCTEVRVTKTFPSRLRYVWPGICQKGLLGAHRRRHRTAIASGDKLQGRSTRSKALIW